jgi:hypothetical protein
MLPAPAFSGKTGASVAKAAPNLIDALSRDAPDLTQPHAEPPSSQWPAVKTAIAYTRGRARESRSRGGVTRTCHIGGRWFQQRVTVSREATAAGWVDGPAAAQAGGQWLRRSDGPLSQCRTGRRVPEGARPRRRLREDVRRGPRRAIAFSWVKAPARSGNAQP